MIKTLQTRLPRFQFFHDLEVLLPALVLLPFIKTRSVTNTDRFLRKMKNFFGRSDAHLVSSFRMGLFHTLKALQLKEGDEVLLTPITIADTVNAIRIAGLKPVFVEMDPETHSICMKDLSTKVSGRSKVILVTYLSGIVPDIDEIRDFTLKNNLVMIEDISQNMDALYKGRRVGSHGDVSIASLSCGKNISSLYGGLILSDDTELIYKLKKEATLNSPPEKSVLFYYLLSSIKVQIATSRLVFPVFVYPLLRILSLFKGQYPLDFNHDPETRGNIFSSKTPVLRSSFPESFSVPVNDWQLQLTIHQFQTLEKATMKRRELARLLLSRLNSESLKQVPKALHHIEHNSFYHFPVFCNGKKSELRKHLFLRGVDNGSYGLNLCTEEAAFGTHQQLPEAKRIKHDSLFLPIHESFSKAQIEHIAEAVNEFYGVLL
jgi:dTDP-4-amino-4,6-dideoxygalactose transaminase